MSDACENIDPEGEETTTFVDALIDIINCHSQENASDTPDFIFAQYMESCLAAFTTASQQREAWYGRGQGHGE